MTKLYKILNALEKKDKTTAEERARQNPTVLEEQVKLVIITIALQYVLLLIKRCMI